LFVSYGKRSYYLSVQGDSLPEFASAYSCIRRDHATPNYRGSTMSFLWRTALSSFSGRSLADEAVGADAESRERIVSVVAVSIGVVIVALIAVLMGMA
jgi:hypothetical protein